MNRLEKDCSVEPVREAGGCRLTVVIPVYNRAERVVATLQSLEAQTLRPMKVVLVDNDSADATFQVLDEWKKRMDSPEFGVTVVRERTPGAAAARNRGLQEVTTPFTMFFDSDDIMSPDHCSRALDGFDKNPEADIVGWDCETVYPSGKKIKVRFHTKDALWANINYGSMATQRYAARTGLFRRAGGWNPSCRGWDDVEIGLRMLYLRPNIVRLSGPVTVSIIHTSDSITGSRFADKTQVWESALEIMESAAGNDKFLSRALNFRRALLAGDYRKEGAVDDANRLLRCSLSKEKSPMYRLLNRIVVTYRGAGLSGIARLLRWFF